MELGVAVVLLVGRLLAVSLGSSVRSVRAEQTEGRMDEGSGGAARLLGRS